jgi:hypothetical protein
MLNPDEERLANDHVVCDILQVFESFETTFDIVVAGAVGDSVIALILPFSD